MASNTNRRRAAVVPPLSEVRGRHIVSVSLQHGEWLALNQLLPRLKQATGLPSQNAILAGLISEMIDKFKDELSPHVRFCRKFDAMPRAGRK